MKPTDVSRRALLGGLGAGGVGFAAGALAMTDRSTQGPTETVVAGLRPVAFHGQHQAGIATAAQDRLAFASFDVTTTDRSELQDVLKEWPPPQLPCPPVSSWPKSWTRIAAMVTCAFRRAPRIRRWRST